LPWIIAANDAGSASYTQVNPARNKFEMKTKTQPHQQASLARDFNPRRFLGNLRNPEIPEIKKSRNQLKCQFPGGDSSFNTLQNVKGREENKKKLLYLFTEPLQLKAWNRIPDPLC
jgi:hypothetical protein